MKKKNNNSLRALILLLVLTMLALIALSGTYAKYTSEVSGTGTAIVAKWDINFAKGDDTLTENFKIDLAETMTTNDNGNTFIQPGSAGSFTITVTNNSQVPATVVASVSDDSASIFKQGQFTLTITGATAGEKIEPNETKELTIDWEWAYSATDADSDDTSIGKASDGATVQTICGITLSATQVDPNA